MSTPPEVSRKGSERMLATAGSFTGLWALAWMGAGAAAVAPAIQGGFAVGGVMAGSGLTVLWWKTRAIRALHPHDDEDAQHDHEMGQSRGGR